MDVDPETMLEWLGVPGDMQVVALEQLCMLLLLSDNVDRFDDIMMSFRLTCSLTHSEFLSAVRRGPSYLPSARS